MGYFTLFSTHQQIVTKS